MKNDNLEHIKCPRCGWHSAVKDKKTGLITCQYCMYRTKQKNDCTNCLYFDIETFYGVCNKHGIILNSEKPCEDFEENNQ